MKQAGNVLIIAGVLLIIYSILEKFVIGAATINLGGLEIHAISGIIFANSLLLIGIAAKLGEK